MKSKIGSVVASIGTSLVVSVGFWFYATHYTNLSKHNLNAFSVYLTLTTLIATILGISIAVLFGINWLFLERKVRKAIKNAVDNIDEKIDDKLQNPLVATTHFLVTLMDANDIDETASLVRGQLEVWGNIPSARTYVAALYVQNCYDGRNASLTPIDEYIRKSLPWITDAMEHKDSEDLRRLYFLTALRSSVLDEPDTASQYLDKLCKNYPPSLQNDYVGLLRMPLSYEIFCWCGSLPQARKAMSKLGIAITPNEFLDHLRALPVSQSLHALLRSNPGKDIYELTVTNNQGSLMVSITVIFLDPKTTSLASGPGTMQSAEVIVDHLSSLGLHLMCLRPA